VCRSGLLEVTRHRLELDERTGKVTALGVLGALEARGQVAPLLLGVVVLAAGPIETGAQRDRGLADDDAHRPGAFADPALRGADVLAARAQQLDQRGRAQEIRAGKGRLEGLGGARRARRCGRVRAALEATGARKRGALCLL
jgi:hypothetical protein